MKLMPPRSYAFLSERNQRDENEDSFLIVHFLPFGGQSNVAVLGVADGMGGYQHGGFVSRETLRRICLLLFEQLTVAPALNSFELEEVFRVGALGKALWEAMQQANDHVRRMIQANKWVKAGSTVVVAVIYEDTAVVVNLGDSPLFHYRKQNGDLTQVTQDHTVAGALMRGGLLSPEMARIHEGSDRLEFFIGNETMPGEPTVSNVALAPGDLLLLCSDGISGALTVEQMTAIFEERAAAGPLDLDALAVELLRASTDTGESDNQTLVLWRHAPSS